MQTKVTVKQIAKELDVSIMTVSRAINGKENVDPKTRERVLKKAKQMGYVQNFIAKSLVQNKTYTIGVVVPEITHSFFPEVIKGIEEVTDKSGYQIILTHSNEDAEKENLVIRMLLSKRVDGLLISTSEKTRDYDTFKKIIKQGTPLVFYDRCIFGIGASCISIDDEKSSMLITEHLISHGYKRIAHLSGPANVSIGKARLNGYKKALKKKSLAYDPELVVESGFQEIGGYLGMIKLLELPKSRRPRAVVAVNDPAAFGALKAIKEKNLRIPRDIAIVGFSDDIRSELMYSPLTTVRQPAYEVGKIAAEKILRKINNNKEKTEDIILPTFQVLRNSCGCAVEPRSSSFSKSEYAEYSR